MNEDLLYVQRIQAEDCEKSLKNLIDKHSALCFNILEKFSSSINQMGLHAQDLYKEKDYLVYKAAKTFKTEKNVKFSTWLGNYTRYYCLTILNGKNKLVFLEDEKLHYCVDKDSEDKHIEKENFKNIKDFVSFLLEGMKDKRAKKIYMLRYFSESGEKMTWKKIAKNMNISSQTAINIHNRAKRILKNKIKGGKNFDFV